MEKEKEIKTGKDLINYIKKNNLEDKKIVVGCQGYSSVFDNELEIVRISFNNNIILISDECGIDEEELKAIK